jgi:hypothetical protein
MAVGTSILTNAGLQKLINALAQGTKVSPKYYKVTDSDVTLDPALTDIPNAWKQADISGYVQIDANTIEFLITIPHEEVTKYGKCFGLYLDDGTLFLVAKPPYPFPPGMRINFKVQFYFEQAEKVINFQYIPFDETEQNLAIMDVSTVYDLLNQICDEINLLHQAREDYYKFKQTPAVASWAEWAKWAYDCYRADNADDADRLGGYLPTEYVRQTIKTINIYVNADIGSDTAGDGTQKRPYKTVAKALSVIPKLLRHNVVINLQKANNSYGSIYLSGFTMESSASLTLKGEFRILASGKVTSFSNSENDPVYGSLVQVAKITDSSKNWTTNQFQYKLIRIYKGSTSYYRTICYNDATSIYCNQTFPVTIDSSWSYEILDWGSVCNYIQFDNNLGTVNIQNLKVSQTSNFYCSVLRRTTIINVDNCLFEGFANGSFATVFTGETNCTISNSVINANNTSGYAVNPTSGAPFCLTVLQGCLVLNNSSSAVCNNYFFSRITLSNGTRLNKGASNPTYGIQMVSGILIGLATYGKVLIDVGQTGIQLTRGAYVQNSIAFAFGPNVTTKISSYFGLVDGSKLQAYDYFGVNIPNYNHENIHSRILCNGSFATKVSTVSANTTLGVDHHIVLVNASGGARTITLPDATTCAGRQYVIKKIDSSTDAVTIVPQSGQTIDGQASISINTQYDYRRVVSDGTNWYLF